MPAMRLAVLSACLSAAAAYTADESAEAHVPADPSLAMAQHMAMEYDNRIERQMEAHYANVKEEKKRHFHRRKGAHREQQELHERQSASAWEMLEAEVALTWVLIGVPLLLMLLQLMRKPAGRRRMT
eukprot:TRINITY_DN31457_c0_g1_i1.p3 TRINITY_DN31457_c0_g1~~TRINITY_DN31457_c0_g1_i1.p3  ORF type:complete len:127 (+),score=58.68 TRINITY_DN31457_c0_g1_i1:57-437(+)